MTEDDDIRARGYMLVMQSPCSLAEAKHEVCHIPVAECMCDAKPAERARDFYMDVFLCFLAGIRYKVGWLYTHQSAQDKPLHDVISELAASMGERAAVSCTVGTPSHHRKGRLPSK